MRYPDRPARHEDPVIHRDIKPENILLHQDRTVFLLDLDAARPYRKEDREDTRLLGTAGYAAPEQYGFGASSAQTDIYALGVLINVMLCGKLPSEGTPRLGLGSVIRHCVHMLPKKRYRSVRQLKKDIAAFRPAASWTLPGFRSPRRSVRTGAFFLYAAIVVFALSQNPETALPWKLWTGRLLCLLFIALPVLFTLNYRDIQRICRFSDIRSPLLRLLAVLLTDALMVFSGLLLLYFFIYSGQKG